MFKFLLNNIPLTRIKILIARFLYVLVSPFVRPNKIIERNKIKYCIDISEGLDLSLFLLGNFQKHVSKNDLLGKVDENDTIFDVGANFGLMSLQFAKQTGAKIYAFEPTDYAFAKLEKNLSLNTELGERISPVKALISSGFDNKEMKTYSSWKINGRKGSKGEHPVHGGEAKSHSDAQKMTLDEFSRNNGIDNVAFIKIDTDGHEYNILLGARELLRTQKPIIIFEIGQYIMNEFKINFHDYENLFEEFNYHLFTSDAKRKLNRKNFNRYIPKYGTTDILAIPNK